MRREILHLEHDGQLLVGTYHKPLTADASAVGFLLLNSGYVPRDGHGGLAVRVCDRLAEAGFHCFRFDLPGLGDSTGELPVQNQEFYDLVTDGHFVAPTLKIERSLRERYHLNGVVLGGLCGASVTALYAADQDAEGVIGVMLFEPEFYLTEPDGQQDASVDPRVVAQPRLRTRPRRASPRRAHRLFNYWGWMRQLTFENELRRYVPLPRRLILKLVLHNEKLPAVTNVPLAGAWRRLVQRRLPILVITAEGKLREVFFDRINRVVLADLDTTHITRHRLAGTNHIFTTGGAIRTIADLTDDWGRKEMRDRPAAQPDHDRPRVSAASASRRPK